MRSSLFIFIFCWSGVNAWAGEYHLGLGFMPYHVMATTTDRGGKTATIGEVHYPAQVRGVWKLGTDTELSARLAYTLLPKQAEDKAGDLSIAMLSFALGERFGSGGHWRWSGGLGVLRHQLAGKGGTVVLQNGGGTATFHRPGRTVASQVITLEGGVGYQFMDEWRSDIELVAMGWMSDRLSFSVLWTWSYTFGGGL